MQVYSFLYVAVFEQNLELKNNFSDKGENLFFKTFWFFDEYKMFSIK